MKDLLVLLAHLLTTLAKLLGPGGARAIVADSLLMKQQLLIINRSRQLLHASPKAPTLGALTPASLQSSATCAQFDSYRPDAAQLLVAISQPTQHSAGCGHSQTLDTLKLSRHAQETQVSIAVYRAQKRKAGTQRSFTGTHRCHRRNEKTKFTVWLSPYSAGD